MTQQKNKIYIVDDNVAVCESIKFLFASFYNLDVNVYYNPLLFLNNFPLDAKGCLIIDLFMPALNGLDLLKELKMRNHTISVIIISGHATEGSIQQALDAGADAFLTKPFKTEHLLSTVQTILQKNP